MELLGEVLDPAHRPGVAVAMNDEVARIRYTLVFDPGTFVLLAEEERVLSGNELGYPAGTVIGHTTYLVTAMVDALGDRPSTNE